jgi:hypothetical protein
MHMNCCGKTHSRSKSMGTTRSNNRGKSPRNKLEMVDTPKVPVGSTYHGVTVAEDYRWLEDPESDQTLVLKHQPSGNGPPGGSASEPSGKKQPRSIRATTQRCAPSTTKASARWSTSRWSAASWRPQPRPHTLRHTAEAPPRSCDRPAWWSPRARMWGTCPIAAQPRTGLPSGLDRCRATSHVQRRR